MAKPMQPRSTPPMSPPPGSAPPLSMASLPVRLRPWRAARSTAASRRRPEASEQAEPGELSHQRGRHHIAGNHIVAEIDWGIAVFEIAPALMRAFGSGMGQDQNRIDQDGGAAALGLAEAENR